MDNVGKTNIWVYSFDDAEEFVRDIKKYVMIDCPLLQTFLKGDSQYSFMVNVFTTLFHISRHQKNNKKEKVGFEKWKVDRQGNIAVGDPQGEGSPESTENPQTSRGERDKRPSTQSSLHCTNRSGRL